MPRRDLLQVNQLREFAAEARALESDHGELIRQRQVRKKAAFSSTTVMFSYNVITTLPCRKSGGPGGVAAAAVSQ